MTRPNSDHGSSGPSSAAKRGMMTSAAVLLAIPLFVMINYLGGRHYQRFDWTSSQIYSLSEKSLQVVGDLDREIDIDLILGAGAGGELFDAVEELIDRYEAANPRYIRKRVVDLAREPLEAERLEIAEGTAVVLSAGTSEATSTSSTWPSTTTPEHNSASRRPCSRSKGSN